LNLTNIIINSSGGSAYHSSAGTPGILKLNQTSLGNSNGKIKFFDVSTTQTAFSSIMSISDNLITLNSNSYLDYNKSANLMIYNAPAYANRIPLRNGAPCPISICTEITDANTYVFSVTGFTNYSVGEGNNTAPRVEIISISFPTPFLYAQEENNLTCNATLTDDEPDTLSAYYFWYHNNILNQSGFVTGISNGTMTEINTTTVWTGSPTDTWNCTVIPYDGIENGTANSDSKTVGASQPQKPHMPGGFKASLASNRNDVVLNWTISTNAEGYYIWYSDNLTAILNLTDEDGGLIDPNVTIGDKNTLSWVDEDANKSQQKYYALASFKQALITFSNNRTGKYDITIKPATGIPGSGNELNLISIPVVLSNASLNALMPDASDGDRIYRFNATTQTYQSARYFAGFGWSGTFENFDSESGYELKPTSSAFNITVIGNVPIDDLDINITVSTGIPGSGNELNLIGWNFPKSVCNLTDLMPDASDGDRIYRFNATTQTYQSARYFAGFGWSGTFDCLDPGKGYELKPVAHVHQLHYPKAKKYK
jgi:hypothetical protein